MMGAVYRLAKRKDASGLYDIRRRSILELAPPIMPKAKAQAWAAQLTLSGMGRKLHELEVWVAELDGAVVGSGAICGDRLEGLYAAPEFAGQGVGAGLLGMLEGLMRDREFPSVHAEASTNARDFYLRRGYRANGPQTPKGAWPIAKRTSIAASGEAEAGGSDATLNRLQRLILPARGATLAPARRG
jgi:putative acetyltransferase